MGKTCKILLHIVGSAMIAMLGAYIAMPEESRENLKDMVCNMKPKSCSCIGE